MAKWIKAAMIAVVGMICPLIVRAQGIANEMRGLHGVLEQLYDEMLPLCSKLISVGQGIAGFAATWYIAARVWRHIANAEPIDFYPLFRPFVLGFAILAFPAVIAMINGVMKPTVTATHSMVDDSDKAIAELLRQKEKAIRDSTPWKMYVGEDGSGDRDLWYRYTFDEDPSDEGWIESIGNSVRFAIEKLGYKFRNAIKEWMSEVLRVLYEAAALCINTIRTFQLIVLAILGPLVFGLAVFDGFQHTLTSWFARYLNVYLWLPVANIFGTIIGKVQQKMIELDISQIQQDGDTFFSSTDAAYLVFLIIGIVGYFTVPSVANYIIHAGGAGATVQKVTNMVNAGGHAAQNAGMAGGAQAAVTAGNIARAPLDIYKGYHEKDGGGYMSDKLKGNS